MLKEGEKVPYLIIRYVCPPHLIDELLKNVMEVSPKYPADPSIDEWVLGATKATEQGHIWMNVWKAKEGQFDAAYARRRRSMAELRNVEGVKHSIEVWATSYEAQVSLGLIHPEQ